MNVLELLHHWRLMSMVMIPQGSTGRGGAPRHQWQRILWSCRDTFRLQIGRLLVHTLSPALPLSDRKEALEFVLDDKHLDILKESLSSSLEVTDRCLGCMSLTVVFYTLFLCILQRKQMQHTMYFHNHMKVLMWHLIRLSLFSSGQV